MGNFYIPRTNALGEDGSDTTTTVTTTTIPTNGGDGSEPQALEAILIAGFLELMKDGGYDTRPLGEGMQRNYTNADGKEVPAEQYLREQIKELAPRCEEPLSLERDTFSLVMEYMKQSDRDLVAKLLKINKPADTQIMSWLVENIHPNRLIFADGVVKRKWPLNYFYEVLAYAYIGKNYSRPAFPKRKAYSKIPSLCRRLGLKSGEEKTLRQLCQDESFRQWAKTKLNNGECRLLGLGEKKIRKSKPKVKIMKLSDYYVMDREI